MSAIRDGWSVKYDAGRDNGIISYEGEHAAPFEVEFQFQHGPVQDNGINGIQNEEVLELEILRLKALNERFPCRENSIAITHIETALLWLRERTRVRQTQGVEGVNVAHVS